MVKVIGKKEKREKRKGEGRGKGKEKGKKKATVKSLWDVDTEIRGFEDEVVHVKQQWRSVCSL